MKKYFVLLLLFTLSNVYAQKLTEFPADPSEFVSALKSASEASKKEKIITAANQFGALIESGTLSGDQLTKVQTLFNLMLSKRYRLSPHIGDYMTGFNSLVAKELVGKFDEWHDIAASLVDESPRGNFNKYGHYMDFSNNYFGDSKVFTQRSKSYIVDAKDFELKQSEGKVTVRFPECDLRGITAKDSLIIRKTSGTYDALEFMWTGKGGNIDWSRNGLDPLDIYCELGEYEMSMSTGEYTSTGALFYYKSLFDNALKGTVVDKFSAPVRGQYRYPQFSSDDKSIKMENLIDQVVLMGGFEIRGVKILGVGTPEKPCRMGFYNLDKELMLNAYTTNISIDDMREVNSSRTRVSLYFDQDSLYHPNLDLFFDGDTKKLRLVRGEKASAQAAFIDSYHQCEIDVDGFYWDLNQPVIDFKMLSKGTLRPVRVESANYYNEEVVTNYLITSNYNPIQKLAAWYESTLESDVAALDFAQYIRPTYTIESIRTVIVDLVQDGFILYNPETNMITILPKAINYSNSKQGKVDYDNIRIISLTKKENAQLDLENNDLVVTGVEKVLVSDSQKVVFFPNGRILRLQRNRNMQIDGALSAGMMDFHGRDLFFDYDEFSVALDSARTMQLYSPPLDPKERYENPNKITPIRTLIEDITGKLYIDRPDNKSGLTDNPEYPIMDATGNSFIYYDAKSLHNGAYGREDFYFRLEPFKLNSVDKLEPEQFKFEGVMHYGNIFPDLPQTSTLQEDLTLGFDDEMTGDNTPIYGGLGVFNGSVDLSIAKGLRGSGVIDFLTAKIYSQDYLFFPDSTLTITDSIYIAEGKHLGASFPEVRNGAVRATWEPYTDSLKFEMQESEFAMFKNKVDFKGDLLLASTGLLGNGASFFDEAEVSSKRFLFESQYYKADTANFQIRSGKDLAIRATDVEAGISVSGKKAEFAVHSDTTQVLLPLSKFSSNSGRIFWDGKEQQVTLKAREEGGMQTFTSTKKSQKGLSFDAEIAKVDCNDGSIGIEGLSMIYVGDSGIIPENNVMNIKSDAKISRLENATIVTDIESRQHTITEASVDIRSSQDFFATGNYNYTNNVIGTQFIPMDSIYVRDLVADEKDNAAKLKAKQKAAKEVAKQEKADKKKKSKEEKITAKELLEREAAKEREKMNLEGETESGEGDEEAPEEDAESTAEEAEQESENDKEASEETGDEQAENEKEPEKKEKKGRKDRGRKSDKSTFVAYTYGAGTLPEDKPLRLDESLNFKGKVRLDSKDPQLTFKGYAKVDLKNGRINPDWFSFEDDIDPNEIKIVIDNPLNEKKDSLKVSISYDAEEMEMSTFFLNANKNWSDITVFETSGQLDYRSEDKSYHVGPSKKLNGEQYRGNVMSVYDEEKLVSAEGAFQLGRDWGMLNLKTGGTMQHNLANNRYKMEDLCLTFDFFFEDKIYDKIAEEVKNLAAENEDLDYTEPGFLPAIVEVVSDKDAEKLGSKIKNDGYYSKPKGFEPRLALSHVDMVWDTLNQTFRSVGKFGLMSIGEFDLGKEIDGFIEFGARESGDFFHLYLELENVETSGKEWYYFYYKNNTDMKTGTKNGILHMISSNVFANEDIAKLNPKKRLKVEGKDAARTFEFTVASMFKKTNFVSRMLEERDAEQRQQRNE